MNIFNRVKIITSNSIKLVMQYPLCKAGFCVNFNTTVFCTTGIEILSKFQTCTNLSRKGKILSTSTFIMKVLGLIFPNHIKDAKKDTRFKHVHDNIACTDPIYKKKYTYCCFFCEVVGIFRYYSSETWVQ